MIREGCNVQNTPYYPDVCGHGGYLFSFTARFIRSDSTVGTENIDVYCWMNGNNQEFCLRTGSDGHEYYSPGGIEYIIKNSVHSPYDDLVDILKSRGKVIYI